MPPKKAVDPPVQASKKSPEPDFETFDAPSTSCKSAEPPDNEVPSLAEAIAMMAHELKNCDTKKSKTKAKEPDTFDGSELDKLNNYIVLFNLFFRSNSAYSDDEAKVTFALFYLHGTALEYFEPSILNTERTPEWLDDWSIFTQTLCTQFGPLDPTADAEENLDNLKMYDNQHILKYNVSFNCLSIQTGWTDGVLQHRYYSGLAERIKDIMVQQGKLSTLKEMKTLAHAIDARYWERHREKSHAKKSQAKSDNKNTSKPENKSENKTGNSGKNAKNNQSNSNTSTNKDNNSNKSAKSDTSRNSVADKLGKDGKLTSDERQHRW